VVASSTQKLFICTHGAVEFTSSNLSLVLEVKNWRKNTKLAYGHLA